MFILVASYSELSAINFISGIFLIFFPIALTINLLASCFFLFKAVSTNSDLELFKTLTKIKAFAISEKEDRERDKRIMQGKTEEDAKALVVDAKALQEAGVFSIVLEMVAAETTKHITEAVFVPTIGIGCGKDCDGQVLVIHDMLGLFEKMTPKFVKKYLSLSEEIKKAVTEYVENVENRTFPAEEHTFHMEVQK